MIENCIIRPVKESDFSGIKDLAELAEYGLTSLPKDDDLLRKNIESSVRSFSTQVMKPVDELYMFVLEDIENKKIVGTSAIVSNVEVKNPFYSFNVTPVHHVSKDRKTEHHLLELSREPVAASELCMLYLHPDYRSTYLGRFLSLARFAFIKSHRHRFRTHMIAELRGLSYPNGDCPFWDAVMQPFFKMPFFEADLMSQTDSSFIEDCIPKVPIYIDLLPQHVQTSIGQVHPNTTGAERILLAEDFRKTHSIDVFDAGPKYEAVTDDIQAIKRTYPCEGIELESSSTGKNVYVVATGKNQYFHSCCVTGKNNDMSQFLCVQDTPAIQRLFQQGKISHYLRLFHKIRQAHSHTSHVLEQNVISHVPSFVERFAKWHDTVERKKPYGFYR